MQKIRLRNVDIKRILMATPKNHKHIRTVVETQNSIYILQEATIANIVRAYIILKTHPTQVGIELTGRPVKSSNEYATYQLIETPKTSQEVIQELTKIID